jgi:hypothetical protein
VGRATTTRPLAPCQRKTPRRRQSLRKLNPRSLPSASTERPASARSVGPWAGCSKPPPAPGFRSGSAAACSSTMPTASAAIRPTPSTSPPAPPPAPATAPRAASRSPSPSAAAAARSATPSPSSPSVGRLLTCSFILLIKEAGRDARWPHRLEALCHVPITAPHKESPKKNPGQRELAGIDLGFRSGHWVSGPAAAESDAHEAGSQQQQGGRLGYRRRRHAEPLAFPLAQAIGPGVCIVRRAMGSRPFVIGPPPAEDQACVRNECFGLLKKVARLIVGAIPADRELALPIAQRAASPSRGRGVSARSRLALATLRGSRFGNASNSASAIPASANASRTIRKASCSSVGWRSAARSPRAPARRARGSDARSRTPSRGQPRCARRSAALCDARPREVRAADAAG